MANSTNTSLRQLYHEYRPAILFLIRFLGIYILGNVIYGIWVTGYGNLADPFTHIVTNHAASLLRAIGFDADTLSSTVRASVALTLDGKTVVNVFEGCNAINVSILFIAFIVAYKGSWQNTVIFSLLGLVSIYLFNLIRVSSLFLVAKFFPDHLYYMHKFVFTGVIYAYVFVLWYLWVKKYTK